MLQFWSLNVIFLKCMGRCEKNNWYILKNNHRKGVCAMRVSEAIKALLRYQRTTHTHTQKSPNPTRSMLWNTHHIYLRIMLLISIFPVKGVGNRGKGEEVKVKHGLMSKGWWRFLVVLETVIMNYGQWHLICSIWHKSCFGTWTLQSYIKYIKVIPDLTMVSDPANFLDWLLVLIKRSTAPWIWTNEVLFSFVDDK